MHGLTTNLVVILFIMANINYTNNDRISGAPWFEIANNTQVIVGGAGGISSWLALFLTRAGIHISIYDFDQVSNVNLAGQFYTNQLIGHSKIEALQYEIGRFSNVGNFFGIRERYTESSRTRNIMLAGFDNMTARKVFFANWKNLRNMNQKENMLFVDGRLLAEQLQILCVRGDNEADIARYETEYLFDDNEVQDAPCTFKQTSHMAAMIAGFMTGFVTNFLGNQVFNADVYELPFFFEYLLPVHQTTTLPMHSVAPKETIMTPVEIPVPTIADNKIVIPESAAVVTSVVSNPVSTNTSDDLLREYQNMYNSSMASNF